MRRLAVLRAPAHALVLVAALIRVQQGLTKISDGLATLATALAGGYFVWRLLTIVTPRIAALAPSVSVSDTYEPGKPNR